MGNKTQQQNYQLLARYKNLDLYNKERSRLIQDNNYYDKIVSKCTMKEIYIHNLMEIKSAKYHNENYIRYLDKKIKRIQSFI